MELNSSPRSQLLKNKHALNSVLIGKHTVQNWADILLYNILCHLEHAIIQCQY